MYRLIWGQKLENEEKGEMTVVSSDPEDGECPCSDQFFNLHDQDETPFVCFVFEEGSGWKMWSYNQDGYELYGESIMGQK